MEDETLKNLSISDIKKIKLKCEKIIKNETDRLKELISKEIIFDDYTIKRYLSNSVNIYYKKNNIPKIEVVYYHHHKTHGGKTDPEGDVYSCYPYYVYYKGNCNCGEKIIKYMTYEDLIKDVEVELTNKNKKRKIDKNFLKEKLKIIFQAIEDLEQI